MITDLINWSLTFLEGALVNYGFWGVFLVFFMGEIIAPIPTVLLGTATGFLLLKGTFSLALLSDLVFLICLPAAVGIALGSLFLYYIGFFVGKPFLDKWGKYFGLSWEEVQKVQNRFEGSYADEITLFSLRAIPIFPTLTISFFGGMIRFPMKSYLLFTFLGSFVRVLIVAILGWQTGDLWRSYASLVEKLEKVGLILLLAFLVFLIFRFRKKHRDLKSGDKKQNEK